MKRILHNLGITALSPMQAAFIKAAHGAHDVMLLAPTGSGKTLAFLLGILERQSTATLTIVVSPSRELARQSHDLLRRMKVNVAALCFVGGHAKAADREQLRALRLKPTQSQIIFATPGRLLDLLSRGDIDGQSTDLLVIDEYDKCLDEGFTDELVAIRQCLPARLATWLISATSEPAELERFVNTRALVRLDYTLRQNVSTTTGPVSSESETRDRDSQEQPLGDRLQTFIVRSPEKDKLHTLGELLMYIGGGARRTQGSEPSQGETLQNIVFVSHRESAERVYKYLHDAGFSVCLYHGGMEQAARERSLLRFRCGGSLTLVSTDLAARGLDIPQVGSVIHYHLPDSQATFSHRGGRATRWENCGMAYVIVGPEEQLPQYIASQANDLELPASPKEAIRKKDIPVPAWAMLYIGRGKKEKLSRGDIAGFICKKGGLRGDDIGRIELGDHQAYVCVRRACLRNLLTRISGEKIKGMKTIIEEANA